LRKPLKLLIVRLSALGDVTHALAVVRAIQAVRPDAEITWLTGKLEHRLLTGVSGVRFVVLDKRAPSSAIASLGEHEPFDALLLMQLSFRAGWLTRRVRARRRIGFDWARSKELHSAFIHERIAASAGPHVLDALYGFLQPLAIARPEQPDWRIPVSNDDHAAAAALLPGDQPTLLLSPASSHPLRNWSVERYAALADAAIERHGLRVALIGSPAPTERALADQIKAAMRHPPLDIVGRDTLKQLVALMPRAVGIVTPDSGPAHIARACGTPVLGLYAATDPRRSGPYRALEYTVDAHAEAARRFLNREPTSLRWGQKIERPGVMDLVQLDAAIAKLDALVANDNLRRTSLRSAPNPTAR
jgi:heptosyltransferase I